MLVLYSFFDHTAPTEIYTLSLHDALPICMPERLVPAQPRRAYFTLTPALCGSASMASRLVHERVSAAASRHGRSEEHTSELQSQFHLVCRLLLEKKKIADRRADRTLMPFG